MLARHRRSNALLTLGLAVGATTASDCDDATRPHIPPEARAALEVVSGAVATLRARTRSDEPIVVLVTRDGEPQADVRVLVTIDGGKAYFPELTTGSDGTAAGFLRVGDPGRVVIELRAEGLDGASRALEIDVVEDDRPRALGYRVLATHPHDESAFTQGLVVADGALYEGTGGFGTSALRRVELETGRVLEEHRLRNDLFGEGIAVVFDRIVQLTWQNQVGFVYAREGFEELDTFSYSHQGWGITYDGQHLLVSDGTDVIRRWDPTTFDARGRFLVHDQGAPVRSLNELEFFDGELYANVHGQTRIARINATTGEVTGWIELDGILPPEDRESAGVLNGIAYDAARQRLLVTGKRWPKLFEIEIVPVEMESPS